MLRHSRLWTRQRCKKPRPMQSMPTRQECSPRAKEIGAAVVHYSTDYVFDGAKRTPYEEVDMAVPINGMERQNSPVSRPSRLRVFLT